MDRILERIKLIPDDYFITRQYKDESIYIFWDKDYYTIEHKDKLFLDKKTNLVAAYEIKDVEIFKTKKETLEKFREKISSRKQLIIEIGKNRKKCLG